MRILVVEDATRLSEIIAGRLREECYAVDTTGSGAEALEMAAGASYDGIVLDLHYPIWTGWTCVVGCGSEAAGRRC